MRFGLMRRMHRMPFGAEVTDEGVRFAIWAPSAKEVTLVLDGAERPMHVEGGGWCRLTVPEARAGQSYGYRVKDGLVVPDPASRFQPHDVHRHSQIVDPRSFAWTDGGWTGRPWEETVLYEVHVGTATPEGTYAGLMNCLADIRDTGITAVELLPLSEFPGRRNWGYDGVLPYAPDSAYGTVDDLKRLIDRAHSLGLMMFLDVVYNHFGPAGNYLHAYAESFFTERHHTPWGAAINFDGADGGPVRDYFVHNALYWLEEFHFDGLRFDAVHAIVDDSEPHIIAEIAERVRAALPDRHVHLVLENGANQARWLPRDGDGRPRLHTAQWNDDVHHCWHVLATGERDGYYRDYAAQPLELLGRCLAEGFAYQGEPSGHEGGHPRGEPSAHLPPSAFVAFTQNHDQIGNRAFGDRITALAPPERLALVRAGLLLTPQIPLLFMGEDWAASTPFQFFVDFSDDPDLARAVREGRAREFQSFTSFAESHGESRIPDPTAEETFRRSSLDWDERDRPPHRDILDETRRLLRLRQTEVVPLTRSAFQGATRSLPAPGVLDVTWRYAAGTLRFVMNAGEDEATVAGGTDGRIVWRSDGVRCSADGLALPAWTGILLKGDAA